MLLLSAEYFQNIKKIVLETLSECLTVWECGPSICTDLGTNCFQRLSEDDKAAASRQRVKWRTLTVVKMQ